ncbi:oxidoreductase [Corynebacterium sp. HMSC062E11]|uniref:SDR family NAD(P)-dependent oxidoreductase n=1 Tax=Corynebacterium hesseae TaxID=2913502 RepID=A0ABU9UI43_9CORY|nr:SDR family NAD(P)-dependent oxidoreductase [Corynebacterium sp. HMSC062E11]MDK6806839.1 SDR family NAD(P)-dependent oxidoreductase [Corynebacterium aurimucosum]NJJ83394.1 SDR family NAD(P)-dependent oxidoreductase [Corynebacterium aurimucosum]OFK29649.1 oxidoreductase [Corynebacterium sp. HMSC062E11]PKZ24828.1 oxidoreductase [Corynebacterium aurimucosum]
MSRASKNLPSNHDPRTIVITGASSGVGAAAARILHQRRPQDSLVLVGRNPEKTQAVAEEVGAAFHVANYESLGQVRRLAEELSQYSQIDALGNNAGGMFDGPFATADGFERTWQINVVAPFLLTSLLRDTLRASDATVVQTASLANVLYSAFDPGDPNTFEKFTAERAYGNAKLGDILLTRYLDSHGLTSVAFHPGVLNTGFGQNSTSRTSKLYSTTAAKHFLGKADKGGENLAYFLSGTPGIHFNSGEYYNNKRKPGLQRPIAKKLSVARRVFDDLGRQLNVEW